MSEFNCGTCGKPADINIQRVYGYWFMDPDDGEIKSDFTITPEQEIEENYFRCHDCARKEGWMDTTAGAEPPEP